MIKCTKWYLKYMSGKDMRPSGAMDMVIMRILIVDPGHPIMMTHGIIMSGMIVAILRMPKDIMILSRMTGGRFYHY